MTALHAALVRVARRLEQRLADLEQRLDADADDERAWRDLHAVTELLVHIDER